MQPPIIYIHNHDFDGRGGHIGAQVSLSNRSQLCALFHDKLLHVQIFGISVFFPIETPVLVDYCNEDKKAHEDSTSKLIFGW